MESIISRVVKKAKAAVRPKVVNSFDDVVSIFKWGKVASVTVEPVCYTTLDGTNILTIAYAGDGNMKKSILWHEVLSTHAADSTDKFLIEEFKKLYPSIRERAEKLRKELGVSVTIPGHFVKALASPSPRSDASV